MKALDLAGQKYNNITVLERDYEYPKEHHYATSRSWWKCKCDCGKFFTTSGTKIKNEEVKSCGCLRSVEKRRDIKGQRFGKLVAIEPTEKRSCRAVIWKCLCDCGNITYQSINNLTAKDGVRSCGCLLSKGEDEIFSLLKINNIPFEKQKIFIECRTSNHPFKFDFYIANNFLLEFDGAQHYYYGNKGWNDKEHFIINKQHDYEKNKWTLENHIKLKRIPFWIRSKITLEDIMGDEYLINEETLCKDLWLINNPKSWLELKEKYGIKNKNEYKKWYNEILFNKEYEGIIKEEKEKEKC